MDDVFFKTINIIYRLTFMEMMKFEKLLIHIFLGINNHYCELQKIYDYFILGQKGIVDFEIKCNQYYDLLLIIVIKKIKKCSK